MVLKWSANSLRILDRSIRKPPWLLRRCFATMPSEAPRYKSIAELLDAIVSGKTTVRAVTEGYLQNISDLNGQLNAVTVTNDRALEDADRLDVRHLSLLVT